MRAMKARMAEVMAEGQADAGCPGAAGEGFAWPLSFAQAFAPVAST